MDVRADQDTECPSINAPACPDSRARRAVRRLRGERGVGLVELLTVIPMSAIVLLGMYGLYNVGVKSQQESNNRVRSLIQQQNGLERLSREMRQATAITPVSSTVLDATTWVRPSDGGPSQQRHVRYDCSSGTCQRSEGPAGETTYDIGPVNVITDVLNADIFTLQPDTDAPTWVTTRIQVRVKGANNPITLEGGFALRNLRAPEDEEHQDAI